MKGKLPLATLCAVLGLACAVAAAEAIAPVAIRGGTFESVLPPAEGIKKVDVKPFRIDVTPVTNEQFAKFVAAHPQWQRDRVARVFADTGYLSHWTHAAGAAPARREQPVTHVSWFAASAYCESRGARLPTWHEWEYVAAASETRADARDDEGWRQRILAWYSKSANGELPRVGREPPNFYGVRDLHGVVWEWVDDLSGMLVSGDNRQQSDPDTLKFCGPGALTMEQKENYATLMRIAMLSSMQASYTSATMGFRCVTDAGAPR
jgi:formylglycine-generating enzyme required for sulfatase activity